MLHGRMSEVLALKTPSTVFTGAKINVDEVCEKLTASWKKIHSKDIFNISLIVEEACKEKPLNQKYIEKDTLRIQCQLLISAHCSF